MSVWHQAIAWTKDYSIYWYIYMYQQALKS